MILYIAGTAAKLVTLGSVKSLSKSWTRNPGNIFNLAPQFKAAFITDKPKI